MKKLKKVAGRARDLFGWMIGSTIRIFILLALVMTGIAAIVLYAENRHSPIQSRLFSRLAKDVSWELKTGPAKNQIYPPSGPFNERRGYTYLAKNLERLDHHGYAIERQSEPSTQFVKLSKDGFIPPFDYTTQTGLDVHDRRGDSLYKTQYPVYVYARYEDIPELVKHTLFFIEDRGLLAQNHPQRSPVVEWDRLALASKDYALNKVGFTRNVPGASTLTTQYFKFTHAPKGQTANIRAKWRQMYSASLFVYKPGQTPTKQTQKVVHHYINHIPLSGQKNWGSVHGLGDALHAFYGLDFDVVNKALANPKDNKETATALRAVASVFVAQRRPTHFFHDKKDLDAYVDLYLNQMHEQGYISKGLRDLTLKISAETLDKAPTSIPVERETKIADSIRYELSQLLKTKNLMSLDRMDVHVNTTIDLNAQRKIKKVLAQKMKDPAFLKANQFDREHLLGKGDPEKLTYSFTLFERLPDRNVLRAQIDTSKKALNINESTRLDLGSTSKLRTLITYLQIMSDIYTDLSPLSRKALLDVHVNQGDRLTYWAKHHLYRNQNQSRLAFLRESMDRKYRASPHQMFLTSGGMHRFSNFNDRYDRRRMSLWSGTRSSVNMVFVRLMQDIVHYYRFKNVDEGILEDVKHPKRQVYLKRWARQDLAAHFSRRWKKWAHVPSDAILDHAGVQMAAQPHHFAAVLKMLQPKISPKALKRQIVRYCWDADFDHKKFIQQESIWSLADRAYVTDKHPIELWIMAQRWRDHDLTRKEALKLATDNIDQFYPWLLEKDARGAQNKFIRIELERDAFNYVHKQWQAMGYPFEDMTPSLATALGASGDRPNALAKMMGILINDGLAVVDQRIKDVRFATGTPYEVHMTQRQFDAPEHVLDPEVAAVAREAAQLVVRRGTARRASGSLGRHVVIGGKTGTGDHRDEKLDKWGRVISSEGIRRSGSFAFFIDRRFFGVMTVYTDEDVDQYDFTSSLTVKIFKHLAPTIKEIYAQSDACRQDNNCTMAMQTHKKYNSTVANLTSHFEPSWDVMTDLLEMQGLTLFFDSSLAPFESRLDMEASTEPYVESFGPTEAIEPIDDVVQMVQIFGTTMN